MGEEEKVHRLILFIEGILYKRLAIMDEDERTNYQEKQEIKKKLIREFIKSLPEEYTSMEDFNEIMKQVLSRINQYIDWEENQNVPSTSESRKSINDDADEKER